MSRWPNKYVIGLTGNIAVGKSVVRQMLQHLGAYTIDADNLSHHVMQPGAPAYKPVVEQFGKFVLDSEKQIDRARLGHIVFNYPDALAKLEAITHPMVVQAVYALVNRAKQRVVVIEAIKLLETDLADACDAIWVVDASAQTQLRRLQERRNLSEEDAVKRVYMQAPQAEKIARATRVIRNDGSVEDTWKQVQAGWNDVRTAMHGTTSLEMPPTVRTQPVAPVSQTPPNVPARAFNVSIRRGMPGNAEVIAGFITKVGGRAVDRMDIMLAFGQKSYLLALTPEDRLVAVLGWQVENLITRADEFYIESGVPKESVINALVGAIEEASRELQSEVGFILLPAESTHDTVQSFARTGYEATTMEQIRVPAWREAVRDSVESNPRILSKKLRADRVMKPI